MHAQLVNVHRINSSVLIVDVYIKVLFVMVSMIVGMVPMSSIVQHAQIANIAVQMVVAYLRRGCVMVIMIVVIIVTRYPRCVRRLLVHQDSLNVINNTSVFLETGHVMEILTARIRLMKMYLCVQVSKA